MAEGRKIRTRGFFHKMANSNSRRNCLKKIKVRGVWLSDEQDIQRGVRGGCQAGEMFSVEEVYLALSELNGDKAPGPDGFPIAFWQPISLVGGLYKILAKVLANRLKKVVGDEAGVLCKLDLEKAYDHINWDFLMLVMQKMGFGEKWAGWIRSGASPLPLSQL
ncbi:hypothetical protein CK203_092212 [Vitis vinifera]|uniref:Reverse transcriptase domain-containing protein n=1 Tax=Vitis vinifera TaxID=29760 RepID=A0A438F295_VITVI|nr:hypothetical protein CK203_092212 [Vitis vinifera]